MGRKYHAGKKRWMLHARLRRRRVVFRERCSTEEVNDGHGHMTRLTEEQCLESTCEAQSYVQHQCVIYIDDHRGRRPVYLNEWLGGY